jgi:phosphatidylethanolamine/phosphatidyl-N-methylethanolamine N-methyltransferase
MAKLLEDHRVFWRQFRQQFHSTGSVMPSGRFLGRALARFVGRETGGQQILEVGPGTGAVTTHILERLGPHDRLDLVELNEEFVGRLRERFKSEPLFCRAASQSRVLHQRIEDLSGQQGYDLIISGLPLNNFSVANVEQILAALLRLLRPGGTLSFFEYIAIRPARALFSGPDEKARLRGIGSALSNLLGPHEIRRDCVWPNFPPAWVHHARVPAGAPAREITPANGAS